MAMLFNMKKPYPNLEVIASQKEEIRRICDEHGIKTTALARTADVAPSTINRFINTPQPANALSSITMAKIRSAFHSHQKDNITDIERGLIGAFQVILAVLTQKIVKEKDLEELLNYQKRIFQSRNLPGAIEVTQELIGFLNSKPRESEIQAIRKLLPPHQAGSV